MSDFSIIFFGTPAFAVAALDRVFREKIEIRAVVTAPDRPAGRGLQVRESEVKIYAKKHSLKILQPENWNDPDFIKELQSLHASLFVVVAFKKLPESLWKIPPKGTINIHASLLPDYRGAAPINWVLINGEKESGVTSIFINERIDAGDIIRQRKTSLNMHINAGELHDILAHEGALLLIESINDIRNNTYKRRVQDTAKAFRKAPALSKESCKIPWEMNMLQIHNFIRGLSPFPGAWTVLDNKLIKIYKSDFRFSENDSGARKILFDQHRGIEVQFREGFLKILELKAEGRKTMSAQDFVRGYQIEQNCFE
jgi:methionyl-tRNA formyltransferase